jgi:glutathione synthase/RimK-type ligase-like ATP-grasp enzyme
MTRIALVTCSAIPELTADDRLLAAALRARGAEPLPVVWDDARVDWSGFGIAVLRSTWDYHLKLNGFLEWLSARESDGPRLWNPPNVVRWNVRKSYLRDLQGHGIAVPPTVWLDRGGAPALAEVMDRRGWRDAVVKPAVSASAFRTFRVSRAAAEAHQPAFDALVAEHDVLLQVFTSEVVAPGEWSLVFIGDELSHSILKQPAEGDFRVQEEFGGTPHPARAPEALVKDARAALAAAGGPLLYARVDGVERQGRLIVMELELTEPALYLGFADGAPERLADAVLARAG